MWLSGMSRPDHNTINRFRSVRLKKEACNQKITNNLHYDTEKDRYICPMGQPMERIGTRHRTTEDGHVQQYARYKAESCSGCPLAGSCKKPQGDEILEINHQLNTYKQRARELLLSEEGIKKRKNRPADVEAVFGQLKHNRNLKRFNLRELPKVEIKMGSLALAHTLEKIAAKSLAFTIFFLHILTEI